MHYRNRFLKTFAAGVVLLIFAAPLWAQEWTPDQVKKAEKLFKLKCVKCHKLYDPADYDGQEWDRWMEKMKKKAHLNEDQHQLLVRYGARLRKDS